jgi:ribosomal protein S18 acetylase RimI-like enzyme
VDEARPRPAHEAPLEELLERTRGLRRELLQRGEFLPPSWSEEASRDLRSGELAGFWLGREATTPGLVVFSRRDSHVFAHIHMEPIGDAALGALRLAETLLHALPREVRRADVGLSGLDGPQETRFAEQAVQRFGGDILVRYSLERALDQNLPARTLAPPSQGSLVPIRSVPLERLAELDWESFRGSPDERLAAETLAEERRSLTELVEGRLGRILEDCSGAIVLSDGRPTAMILVAEQAPGRSIVLDLVVDPTWRRRGIASYLLQGAIDRLTAGGGEAVRLWVTDTNLPARALYDRLGFRTVHSARIYRWTAPHR